MSKSTVRTYAMRAGAKFDLTADFVSDRVWISAPFHTETIWIGRGLNLTEIIISLKNIKSDLNLNHNINDHTTHSHLLESPVVAEIACKTAVLNDADGLPLLCLIRLLLNVLILLDGRFLCLKNPSFPVSPNNLKKFHLHILFVWDRPSRRPECPTRRHRRPGPSPSAGSGTGPAAFSRSSSSFSCWTLAASPCYPAREPCRCWPCEAMPRILLGSLSQTPSGPRPPWP